MNHPANLKYASTHEWIKIEDGLIITGISDHAQDALGDIVYVEAPEIGRELTAGEVSGTIESVKTASDIHAPVSGIVVEINPELEDEPEIINEDPYNRGWVYKIKPHDIADIEHLLTNTAYEQSL